MHLPAQSRRRHGHSRSCAPTPSPPSAATPRGAIAHRPPAGLDDGRGADDARLPRLRNRHRNDRRPRTTHRRRHRTPPVGCGGDHPVRPRWRERDPRPRRARRHFLSRAQRLALVERDGGCAFCHLPPQYAEAHHIRWWQRDDGPTDLSNGVLLCTACHHREHNDGWDIRVESPPGDATAATAAVWFIPPPHVDPTRTPRLGGRRRFDPLAWGIAA